jgi:homoserine O-acetyltransferase
LYLVGDDRALDPHRYFIVVVNLLGNGVSTSPSHGLGTDFPVVSIADNVRLQARLLREELQVRELALAVGHSMGAIQAYHLAALEPRFVRRLAPICGAARISDHNRVFLDGMRGILQSEPGYAGGRYTSAPLANLRTLARAWAAWPPSPHFYRNELYRRLGYRSLEDYLARYWEATYTAQDPNNLLAQLATWQTADVGKLPPYGGDFARALAAIEARAIVMPCVNDAYFPPDDSMLEVTHLRDAELRPIQSQWGHWAGSGRNPADTAFIDAQLRRLLAH